MDLIDNPFTKALLTLILILFAAEGYFCYWGLDVNPKPKLCYEYDEHGHYTPFNFDKIETYYKALNAVGLTYCVLACITTIYFLCGCQDNDLPSSSSVKYIGCIGILALFILIVWLFMNMVYFISPKLHPCHNNNKGDKPLLIMLIIGWFIVGGCVLTLLIYYRHRVFGKCCKKLTTEEKEAKALEKARKKEEAAERKLQEAEAKQKRRDEAGISGLESENEGLKNNLIEKDDQINQMQEKLEAAERRLRMQQMMREEQKLVEQQRPQLITYADDEMGGMQNLNPSTYKGSMADGKYIDVD